jgi:hypothetical protein
MGNNIQENAYSIKEIKSILADAGYKSGTLLEFTGDFPFFSHNDFWNYLDDFDIYHLSSKQYCEDLLFLFGEPLLLIDISSSPPSFLNQKDSTTGFFLRFMYKNQLFSTSEFRSSSSGLDLFKRIFNLYDPVLFLPEQEII